MPVIREKNFTRPYPLIIDTAFAKLKRSLITETDKKELAKLKNKLQAINASHEKQKQKLVNAIIEVKAFIQALETQKPFTSALLRELRNRKIYEVFFPESQVNDENEERLKSRLIKSYFSAATLAFALFMFYSTWTLWVSLAVAVLTFSAFTYAASELFNDIFEKKIDYIAREFLEAADYLDLLHQNYLTKEAPLATPDISTLAKKPYLELPRPAPSITPLFNTEKNPVVASEPHATEQVEVKLKL